MNAGIVSERKDALSLKWNTKTFPKRNVICPILDTILLKKTEKRSYLYNGEIEARGLAAKNNKKT
jgi:hypothetical protein